MTYIKQFVVLISLLWSFSACSASNENLANPEARAANCQQVLKDQIYIVSMHNADIEFNRMRQKATNSFNGSPEFALDAEHYAKILKLIDEAEEASSRDALQDWINKYWKACMGEDI